MIRNRLNDESSEKEIIKLLLNGIGARNKDSAGTPCESNAMTCMP